MTDKPTSKTPGTGRRGPSYPAFGLDTAIQRLKDFHAAQRTNAVSVEAAIESLGYQNPKSSTAQRAVAALLSYNLLTEEGSGASRKVKITDLGRKILLLPEDDSDRIDAVKEAALSPKIYRDMLNEWSDSLPSDTELSKYLTFNKGYNEDAVRTLIKSFRVTYDFAKIGSGEVKLGIESNPQISYWQHSQNREKNESSPPSTQANEFGKRQQASYVAPETRALTIPISGARMAVLHIPDIFSEQDFEFLRRYIDLMKEAFITSHPNDKGNHSTVKTGPAVWTTQGVDHPITVTDYAGEKDGRKYVKVENSFTAIPLDEVKYL